MSRTRSHLQSSSHPSAALPSWHAKEEPASGPRRRGRITRSQRFVRICVRSRVAALRWSALRRACRGCCAHAFLTLFLRVAEAGALSQRPAALHVAASRRLLLAAQLHSKQLPDVTLVCAHPRLAQAVKEASAAASRWRNGVLLCLRVAHASMKARLQFPTTHTCTNHRCCRQAEDVAGLESVRRQQLRSRAQSSHSWSSGCTPRSRP